LIAADKLVRSRWHTEAEEVQEARIAIPGSGRGLSPSCAEHRVDRTVAKANESDLNRVCDLTKREPIKIAAWFEDRRFID
jgi:hypothetical protein